MIDLIKKCKRIDKIRKEEDALKKEIIETLTRKFLPGNSYYSRDKVYFQEIKNGCIYFEKSVYVGCGEYSDTLYKVKISDFQKMMNGEIELTDKFKTKD